jgi:hypothetical protein
VGGSESGPAVGSADGRGVSCTCARAATAARLHDRPSAPARLRSVRSSARGIGWAVGLHGWSTLEHPGVPWRTYPGQGIPWSTLEDLPRARRTVEYPGGPTQGKAYRGVPWSTLEDLPWTWHTVEYPGVPWRT